MNAPESLVEQAFSLENTIKRTINRFTRNREDTRDIFQDALISLWTHAGDYDPSKASFLTWFRTIARRKAIDYLKAKRELLDTDISRESFRESTFLTGQVDERVIEPALELEAKESNAKVYECVAELPNDYRELLEMRHWEGASYRVIASTFGMPEGTVKSALYRARRYFTKKFNTAA